MKIGVPAEGAAGETRVAVSPDTVKAFVKKGLEVAVEAGAGKGSFIADELYAAAGAKVVKSSPRPSRTPTSCSPCAARPTRR